MICGIICKKTASIISKNYRCCFLFAFELGKRCCEIDDIAYIALETEFNGVEKCFAIQAGREIRVMVKPDEVKDDEMVFLARDIAKKIENELEYPGQIKVMIIRENRKVDYAK